MSSMIHDRWFFWTIAIIIIVGFSLWGYIQYTIIEIDNEANVIAIG